MSCIKCINIRANKLENILHKEDRNQSIAIDPEITQIIELVNKDIKNYYNYIEYIKDGIQIMI